MSKPLRKECSSVGSDESGTGGLFGGFTVAAFRLTKENLKILKRFPWFKEIKDAKELTEEKVIELADNIKKALEDKEPPDFQVELIEQGDHNKLMKKYGGIKDVLCIKHRELHKSLENNYTVHMIDNFLKGEEDKYKEYSGKNSTLIDKFVDQGEKQILSITLASILATAEYIKHLRDINEQLGINISVDANHQLKHQEIKNIFLKLKGEKKSHEYVFSNFCKKNIFRQCQEKYGWRVEGGKIYLD